MSSSSYDGSVKSSKKNSLKGSSSNKSKKKKAKDGEKQMKPLDETTIELMMRKRYTFDKNYIK